MLQFLHSCCLLFKTAEWVFWCCLRRLYPKKIQILKKKIASNEVSTCSGWCGILQLCDVREGGLEGVERHYNSSVFNKYLQKDRSPATSKEPKSHVFWATGLILESKEAEFRDLQSYREFFSIFEFWQKLHSLKFQFFRQKSTFWRKKNIYIYITQELKWNSKKTL